MTSFEPQRALQTANAPGISHLSTPPVQENDARMEPG
jgi:hypothetical protein